MVGAEVGMEQGAGRQPGDETGTGVDEAPEAPPIHSNGPWSLALELGFFWRGVFAQRGG